MIEKGRRIQTRRGTDAPISRVGEHRRFTQNQPHRLGNLLPKALLV